MSLVTLRTYTSPSELAVVRSLLDSEGIETVVLNENIIQVQPFLSNAVGGIKLLVLDEDYERAVEILTEAELITAVGESAAYRHAELENLPSENARRDSSKLTCPFCHSEEIVKEKFSMPVFAISVLLLGFPIPFLRRKYHCFDCGRDFKLKRQTDETG